MSFFILKEDGFRLLKEENTVLLFDGSWVEGTWTTTNKTGLLAANQQDKLAANEGGS